MVSVPDGMVVLVVVGVQVLLVLKVPPEEELDSVTEVAVATLDGLPNWSCVWTVMIEEQTPAIKVWVGVMKTSFEEVADLTAVSICEALVNPDAEAVMVGPGLAALVSVEGKLAVGVVAVMVTLTV